MEYIAMQQFLRFDIGSTAGQRGGISRVAIYIKTP
jgi:hypothetical protein